MRNHALSALALSALLLSGCAGGTHPVSDTRYEAAGAFSSGVIPLCQGGWVSTEYLLRG